MPPEIIAPAEAGLVRALGVRQLTATVFNYTVGSGIFALPAFAYAQLGSAAPLGFVVTAIMMLMVALCFAAAGSRVAVSGGPYAYAEVAFGSFAGAVTGALFWLTCLASGAAVLVLFADSVARLAGLASAPLFSRSLIVTAVVVFSWINVRGVRTGARAVEIATVAKLLPLIVFIVVGAFFVQPANLRWTQLPDPATVMRSAGLLVFAFAGVEAAVTPGGEVREPARTMPRAVLLSFAITTALYVAIQLVAQGVLGAQLAADRTTPLATAAGTFLGPLGQRLIVVGASISMLGFISGDLLATPRSVFAFGRDGLLPRAFAAVHPRYHTPHVAILTYAAVTAALALSGTFEKLAILANVSILTLYVICAAAALALQRRDVRSGGEPFRLPAGPLIPILAMIILAWVCWQTVTARELRAVGAVLALGAALFLIRARRLTTVVVTPE